MSTKTVKCPYCGAGFQSRQISSSHLSACAKKNKNKTIAGVPSGPNGISGLASNHSTPAEAPGYSDIRQQYERMQTLTAVAPKSVLPTAPAGSSVLYKSLLTEMSEAESIMVNQPGYAPQDDHSEAQMLITAFAVRMVNDNPDTEAVTILFQEAMQSAEQATDEETASKHHDVAVGLWTGTHIGLAAQASQATAAGIDPYEEYDPEDRDAAVQFAEIANRDIERMTSGVPISEWELPKLMSRLKR